MGFFDNITTISLRFSDDKIDRIAGDSIPLDTIFDADRNTVNTDALDLIRIEITSLLTQACTRTTNEPRIDILVNNHMPLYFINTRGSRRGL